MIYDEYYVNKLFYAKYGRKANDIEPFHLLHKLDQDSAGEILNVGTSRIMIYCNLTFEVLNFSASGKDVLQISDNLDLGRFTIQHNIEAIADKIYLEGIFLNQVKQIKVDLTGFNVAFINLTGYKITY